MSRREWREGEETRESRRAGVCGGVYPLKIDVLERGVAGNHEHIPQRRNDGYRKLVRARLLWWFYFSLKSKKCGNGAFFEFNQFFISIDSFKIQIPHITHHFSTSSVITSPEDDCVKTDLSFKKKLDLWSRTNIQLPRGDLRILTQLQFWQLSEHGTEQKQ